MLLRAKRVDLILTAVIAGDRRECGNLIGKKVFIFTRLLRLARNDKLKKKCIFLYLVTLDQNLFIKNRNAGLVFLCTIYLFDSFNFSGILEKPFLGEQMFSVQSEMQLELLLNITLRNKRDELLVFGNEGFFRGYQCLQS